jgi:DNA-binding transcriptional LysR family regulator
MVFLLPKATLRRGLRARYALSAPHTLKYSFTMDDDFSGLRPFVVTARRRSFTAAAAELGVSPSAVSQSVRALEERLGVQLLQRTTRSVGTTEAGAQLLARLGPLLGELAGALEEAAEHGAAPRGTLTLSVPRIGYHELLLPKLAAFLAAHPHVTLDVRLEDSLSDIVAQGIDAGIRIGERLDESMVAVRVSGPLSSAVVGSPSYFAAHGRPRRPRDVLQHACILYRHVTGGDLYRWEFTEDGVDLSLAVPGRLIVNDLEAMVGAALRGVGLAHVLTCSVTAHLESGRLVRVLAPHCPPFPGFFLYFPSRKHLAPKLRALIDALSVKSTRPRR